LDSSIRALVCLPNEKVVPDLVKFIEVFTRNKEGKIALHVARMLQVEDRESSILLATRSSMVNLGGTSFEDHFSKLENFVVSTDKIIGSSAEFPRDILELVVEHRANIVFYPWQKSEDTLDTLCEVVSALFVSSPATVGVFIFATTTPVQDFPGHGKIFIPFFGGENDREAVLFGTSLSAILPVVIGIYSAATTIKSESTDVHHEHAFTSAQDDEFIESINKLIDTEKSGVTSVKREYKSPEEATTALEQDLAENYSLVLLGRNILDGWNEQPWTKVFGTVAAEFLERDIPSNFLIINKSKLSPRYSTVLPVVELTESEVWSNSKEDTKNPT